LFKRSTLALVEFAVDAQCRDIIVTAFQFGSRSMKPGIPALALLTAGSAFAVSVAAAQTAPKPAAAAPAQALFAVSPYKNLKVFPQDITRAQLLSNMKLFSQSLGVRCTYCHVGTEGQPLSTFDFASDAKEHKVIARDMLRMAHRLNTDLPGITGDPSARISCFTCHRGSEKPVADVPAGAVLVPPPPGAAPPPPPKP